MRIRTLMDNVAYKRGIKAEHGFSALIDTGTEKVLFDTGQTDGFLANAEALKEDLSAVSVVVLSHGHYDHTGGLTAFCRINRTARIYCKAESLQRKFVDARYIGMPLDAVELRSRFSFVEASTELVSGVRVEPDIPIRNEWDTHFRKFTIQEENQTRPDLFEDELYLTIRTPEGLVVVSGCSHRGITNIAAAAREKAGEPIRLILGGFHVREESPETIVRIIRELDRIGVGRLGVSHCTGVDGYAAIKGARPNGTFYNFTGNVVEL